MRFIRMAYHRDSAIALRLLILIVLIRRSLVGSQGSDDQLLAGGVLKGMHFLDKDNGKYVKVLSSVTVAEGSSLTVGAGITLMFPQSTGIIVLGSLRVEGTDANPVIFRPEVADSVWEGIHITGPTSHRSVLRGLTLWNTEIGVKVTNGASVTAHHVTVESPKISGIVLEDSMDAKLYDVKIVSAAQESCAICVASGYNLVLDGCEVDRGTGLTVGIQARNTKNILINNCKISGGRVLGLELFDVYGNITVTSSQFPTNYGGSLIQTDASRESAVLLERIKYTSVDFSGYCIKIVCPGRHPGSVTMRNSVVYGCDRAVDITLNNQRLELTDNQLYFSHQALHLQLDHKASTAELRGNLFYYNTNSDRLPAVSVTISPADFSGHLLVSGNLFQQNRCQFTLRVLHMSPGKDEDMSIEIIKNQFVTNTIDLSMTGDKAIVMLKFLDLPAKFLFQNNTLSNPAVQYDLALGATSGERGYVVDVSRNWWESKKTALQIEERILAQHIDPGRAEVIIEPFVISFEPYVLSSACTGRVCECPAGYRGQYCEQFSCDDVLNCTEHGSCTGPNVCSCLNGWQGVSCSDPLCDKNCSGRGQCFAPNRCACDPGFSGHECETSVCPQENGQCLCTEGWTGEECDSVLCTGVNNCSGHGQCIDVNTCNCSADWGGENCSVPSCASLQYCDNHGNCTEDGVCSCLAGWAGESCSEPDCSGRQNCSGYGNCVAPDNCVCDDGRAGEDCDVCEEGFWGRDCLPCLKCDHGMCNEEGYCTCDNHRWTGGLCARCAEGFYGDNCHPLPTVIKLVPDGGPIGGETVVMVQGHNLPNVTTFACRFGDTEVPGTLINVNEVNCISPPGERLSVPVSVRPDSPEGVYVDSMVNFTYFGECPENSCGEDETPSRGECLLGACSCNSPWSGDHCSDLRLAPDIAKVPAKYVQEFEDFYFQPHLIQGSEPIAWVLTSEEKGLEFDPRSGIVIWSPVICSHPRTELTVSARNDLGFDNETVNLTVIPACNVTSLHINPTGPFTTPLPVTLSGEVECHLAAVDKGPVTLHIRIEHNNISRTLETSVNEESMTFEETFFPTHSDVGYFSADARHPCDSGFQERVSWTVVGLVTSSQILTFKGHVGEEISAGFLLENRGTEALTDLRYTISAGNKDVDIRLWTPSRSNIPEDDVIVTELAGKQSLPVNISIHGPEEIRTSAQLTFICNQMANATVELQINIGSKGTLLALTPSELNVTIFRGKERSYEVVIENRGGNEAFDLQLEASPSDDVSILAFDKLDTTDLDYEFLDLKPGERAMMVVLVAPPPDANIGEKRESITVRAQESQSTIWVNLYILSEETLNVTVTVEDERACLSDSDLGVSSAVVQLSNAARDFHMELTTDRFGQVIFPEINEDYYDMVVISTGHKSKTGVIFVTPGEENVKIKLATIAVNLSWVESDDPSRAGDVDLKTEFSAEAPVPVITVQPSTVDLGDIESGAIKVINLQIENHGLIKASNLTIQFPEHPFLQFFRESADLGELPVNGTVMVLVQTALIPDSRQSNHNTSRVQPEQEGDRLRVNVADSIPHLVIKVLYSHSCDETFHKEVDVILKRNQPRSSNTTTTPDKTASQIDLPELDYNIPLVQSVFCDRCLMVVSECAHPIDVAEHWRQCAAGVFHSVQQQRELSETVLNGVLSFLQLFLSCGDLPGYTQPQDFNATQDTKSTGCSVYNFKSSCMEKFSLVTNKSGENTKEVLAPGVALSRLVVQGMYDMRNQLLPEPWTGLTDALWFKETVKPILAAFVSGEMLPGGAGLSDALMDRLPPSLSLEQTSEFFSKVNRSLYSWQKGEMDSEDGAFSYHAIADVMDSFTNGLMRMAKEGYSDPLTWYNYQITTFNESPKGDQTCAKAKLRLDKKLVEVDDHVMITLEIENGDLTSLQHMDIDLLFTDSINGGNYNSMFAIEVSVSEGLESGTGSWILPLGASGSLQWKVTPSLIAAKSERGKFEVQANIAHSFMGSELKIPIRGDVLTVVAAPRLQIHYFYPFYPSETIHSLDTVANLTLTFGMVAENTGGGTLKDLKIQSMKLTILNSVTNKSLRCQIDSVLLDNKKQTPTFDLHLRNITPGEIVYIQWALSCQEAGKFSNVTMSFVRMNTQGDRVMCTPDLVFYHAVYHEVRVDTSGDDDQLVDPLVLSASDMTEDSPRPDTLFRTDRGFGKSQVLTTEITECHEVLQSNEKTELQILVEGAEEGWYWVKIPYDFSDDQELKRVRRHDAKLLLLNYNVWLTKDQYGNKAIHLFDWLPLSDWGVRRKRQASAFSSYFLELGVVNRPPTFPKTRYETSIKENADFMTTVIRCPAMDSDNEVVYYEVTSYDGDIVPFSVTDTGVVVVTGILDRELQPVYRIKVVAFDNGDPVASASTALGITILDENDNVPVFTQYSYSLNLFGNVSLGSDILTVHADDPDDGVSGKVIYSIPEKDSLPFQINPSEGDITVFSPLADSFYNFKVEAKNPNSSEISTTRVAVNIIRPEEILELFRDDVIHLSVPENEPVGLFVANVIHNKEILSKGISFELLSNVPFHFNSSTGDIFTASILDREERDFYNFTIRAVDNPEIRQERQPEEIRVLVNVTDLNDNNPSFSFPEVKLHILEDRAIGDLVHTICAEDPDLGPNGHISAYELTEEMNDTGGQFEVNQNEACAEIRLVEQLDRETQDRYILVLKGEDDGIPSKTGTVTLFVTVGDVNDNKPNFPNLEQTVNVSKVLPTNSKVFQANATDNDSKSSLHYDITDPSGVFDINADTGVVTLKKSLKSSEDLEHEVLISVTDGVGESNMTLIIIVSQDNLQPPVFELEEYHAIVKETALSGTFLEIVFADDGDGDWVTYFIESGNEDATFHIDGVTGEIMTRYSLDEQERANFTLTVGARDGKEHDPSTKSGWTTVYVTVTAVNQYAPFFPAGEIIFVNVSEGVAIGTIIEIPNASDEDDDEIFYSLLDETRVFSVDTDTSDLYVEEFLDREITENVSLKLLAADGGSPPKSCQITVVITVQDVNDNPPVLLLIEEEIKVTQNAIRLQIPIYQVKATDADYGRNAELTYSLMLGMPLLRIDNTGAIYCLDTCLTLHENVTIQVVINVKDNGLPQLETSNSTRFHIIVFPSQGEDLPSSTWPDVMVLPTSPFRSELPWQTDTDTAMMVDFDTGTLHPTAPLRSEMPWRTDTNTVMMVDSDTGTLYPISPFMSELPWRTDTDTAMMVDLDTGTLYPTSPFMSELPWRTDTDTAMMVESASGTLYPASPFMSELPWRSDADTAMMVESASGALYPTSPFMSELPWRTDTDTAMMLESASGTLHPATPFMSELPWRTVTDTEMIVESDIGLTSDLMPSEEHLYPFEVIPTIYTTEPLFSDKSEEFSDILMASLFSGHPLQDLISPTASSPTWVQSSTDFNASLPEVATTRPLPTAARPLEEYEDLCRYPIDAVLHDRAGVFFFQDNYLFRVFESRRTLVRGYPKTIRRVFAGWRRQKVTGPINAAVHSETSGYTYLFKGESVWIFESHRLIDIAEVKTPTGPIVPDAAIASTEGDILLIEGSDVYTLLDEDDLTLSEPEPIQSVFPGVPVPLHGAFVDTAQKTVYFFSEQVVYEWDVSMKTISADSPYHITKWMHCEL